MRTLTVEVECEEDHCEDGDCLPCEFCGGDGTLAPRAVERLEYLWSRFGPEGERFCRLDATTVEPWRSLADLAYGRVTA